MNVIEYQGINIVYEVTNARLWFYTHRAGNPYLWICDFDFDGYGIKVRHNLGLYDFSYFQKCVSIIQAILNEHAQLVDGEIIFNA